MTNNGITHYGYGEPMIPIPSAISNNLLDTEQMAEQMHANELEQKARDVESNIEEILANDSHEETIEGIQMLVSNGAVRGKAPNGLPVFARVYKTTDPAEERTGILFDFTEDPRVVTNNSFGISVHDGAIVVGSEFVNGIDVSPDDSVYKFAGDVTSEILTKIKELEIRKQADRQATKRRKEYERRERREAVYEILGSMVEFIPFIGIIGGMATAVVLILNSEELPNITDKATILSIGQTAVPAFSKQILETDTLSTDNIYPIPGNSFQNGDVRQLILKSSKPGKNCTEETFDDGAKPNLSTQMKLWTDAVNPDGTPRNDQISVTYTLDGLKACWVQDTQRNSDEKLRVVAQWVDPAPEENAQTKS